MSFLPMDSNWLQDLIAKYSQNPNMQGSRPGPMMPISGNFNPRMGMVGGAMGGMLGGLLGGKVPDRTTMPVGQGQPLPRFNPGPFNGQGMPGGPGAGPYQQGGINPSPQNLENMVRGPQRQGGGKMWF